MKALPFASRNILAPNSSGGVGGLRLSLIHLLASISVWLFVAFSPTLHTREDAALLTDRWRAVPGYFEGNLSNWRLAIRYNQ